MSGGGSAAGSRGRGLRARPPASVEQVVTTTLEETPADATHWSTRRVATQLGMSQSAVSRIWRAFGLEPRKSEAFKLSRDPQFIDKVRDVVAALDVRAGTVIGELRHRHRSVEFRYIAATNADPKPFVWTKTADEILKSVARYCQRTANSHR